MLIELYKLIKWLFSSKPSDIKKVEVVEMRYFPFKGFSAMSWCGKLIVHEDFKVTDTIKNHETIHLKQAQAVGSWIRFYLLYFKEWILGNPFFPPFISAYYTISYEMEAYANEYKKDYTANYDVNNIKKYRIKNRKKQFKKQGGTARSWKKYIMTIQ